MCSGVTPWITDPGSLLRDRRPSRSLPSLPAFVGHVDADCPLNCYMPGLMAIDWLLLIAVLGFFFVFFGGVDYLAGSH